jgi:hypothetical protein
MDTELDSLKMTSGICRAERVSSEVGGVTGPSAHTHKRLRLLFHQIYLYIPYVEVQKGQEVLPGRATTSSTSACHGKGKVFGFVERAGGEQAVRGAYAEALRAGRAAGRQARTVGREL